MSAPADSAPEAPVPPPAFLTAVSVLDSLVRAGLRHAVLAPGSRSAPLAYALAALADEQVVSLHVRLDERSAGFTALGLARAVGSPVAVVTTSGTAVGELMPAVMEADHSAVPLVVLSADRPPRLRGTGANQTTWQDGIYGVHVRAAADLTDYPEDAPGPQTAAFAACLAAVTGRSEEDWERAGQRAVGPVQINTAFDDPLTPDEPTRALLRRWARSLRDVPEPAAPEPAAPEPANSEPADPAEGTTPPAHPDLPAQANSAPAGAPAPHADTVVLAGDGAGERARRFAEALGLPLLAEPSSGARAGANALGPYRLLLDRQAHPLAGRIRRMVLFGRPTLSRPVARLLEDPEVTVIACRPEPIAWAEPGRRRETVVRDPEALAASLGAADPEWLAQWRAADARAAELLERRLAEVRRDGLVTGVDAARLAWEASARDGSALMVGSSNPIRDLDLVPRAGEDPVPAPVVANRGLAGIDGTIATATGLALGLGRPVRALMGDLTFLHDAGSLLFLDGEPVPDLQILVFNDSGGGIFSTLEHAQVGADPGWTGAVERLFGTPQGADLARLVAGYGHAYARATGPEHLERLLAERPSGLTVIEIPGSREGLTDLHRKLRQPPE